MKITHYQPEHPLLQPLIAGIYLLEREPADPAEEYVAFPGIHHFVTLNESAELTVCGSRYALTHRPGSPPSALLVANFDQRRTWCYQGHAREWNICFQPLAIHSFFENPGPLDSGVKPLDLSGHLENLYSLADTALQLRAMEHYWLSRLRPFQHPFLSRVLDRIRDEQNGLTNFTRLAAELNISRHTLHASFKRYIGTTPARFEKIARFRRALSAYREAGQARTLSGISAQATYFDQSHMIRDFRALTGRTPKNFCEKAVNYPGGGINWIFA